MGAVGTVLKPLQTKETIDDLFGEIRQFRRAAGEGSAGRRARMTSAASGSWP